MKFTSTPFAALKLFLFVFFFSVTSASYIRSEAFQPGGEYAEYEPFTIVVSDFHDRRSLSHCTHALAGSRP